MDGMHRSKPLNLFTNKPTRPKLNQPSTHYNAPPMPRIFRANQRRRRLIIHVHTAHRKHTYIMSTLNTFHVHSSFWSVYLSVSGSANLGAYSSQRQQRRRRRPHDAKKGAHRNLSCLLAISRCAPCAARSSILCVKCICFAGGAYSLAAEAGGRVFEKWFEYLLSLFLNMRQ